MHLPTNLTGSLPSNIEFVNFWFKALWGGVAKWGKGQARARAQSKNGGGDEQVNTSQWYQERPECDLGTLARPAHMVAIVVVIVVGEIEGEIYATGLVHHRTTIDNSLLEEKAILMNSR